MKENFLKRFFKPQVAKELNFGTIQTEIAPDMTETQRLKSYENWAYSCITAIVEPFSDIDLQLFQLNKKGEVDELVTHEALDLLLKVNPFQTLRGFLQLHGIFMELAGESFWYLETGKDKPLPTDKPKELWLLRPDWIKVVPDSKEFIKGYIYQPPNGKKLAFAPHEVIQFKYENPINFFRGYSPMQAGAYSIDTHKFSSKWNRNFFWNSARPDGVLELAGTLGDKAFRRLKAEWEATYRGVDKASKVAILEGGIKYSPAGMSPKDMDFKELRNMTRDEILAIWRVPKAILGITDDVNRANAETTKTIFLEQVVKPKMQKLVDTLNEFLLARYSDSLYLDFVDPVPENREQKISEYEKGHNKWLTTNEIRREENLPDISGGDSIYIPINLVEVGGVEGGETKSIIELKKKENTKFISKQNNRRIKMIKAGKDRLRLAIDIQRRVEGMIELKKKELEAEKLKDRREAELLNEIAQLETEKTYHKTQEEKQKKLVVELEGKNKALASEADEAKEVAEDALKLNQDVGQNKENPEEGKGSGKDKAN